MAHLPAFCPSCGLIFESRAIGIAGGVQHLEIENVRETCPRCGAMAELPDGTFSVTGDTIEVLSATPLTRERLLRLALILGQARNREEVADADIATDIEPVEPELAAILMRLPPKARHALIVLLFAVLQVLAGTELGRLASDGATQEQLAHDVQKIERTIKRQEAASKIEIAQAVHQVIAAQSSRQPDSQRHVRTEPTAQLSAAKRPKRPKTYGRNKRKRRR